MANQPDLSPYLDRLKAAGLKTSDLQGLQPGDIANLTIEEQSRAEDERIRIANSAISDECKERALNALDPSNIHDILSIRDAAFESLSERLLSLIPAEHKDFIFRELVQKSDANPELLDKYVRLASSAFSDPFEALNKLIEARTFCNGDLNMYKGFVDLAVSSKHTAQSAIQQLIDLREVYEGNRRVFQEFVEIGITANNVRSVSAMKALARAKDVYSDDIDMFYAIAELGKYAITEAPTVIQAIINLRPLYDSDPDTLRELIEIGKTSYDMAEFTIEELLKLKEECGDDKDLYRKFADAAKLAGRGAPTVITTLDKVKKHYIHNEEMFNEFLEFSKLAGKKANLVLPTLFDARKIYGTDLARMKKVGMNLLGLIQNPKVVYQDTLGCLSKVASKVGDNLEVFEQFIEVAKAAGNKGAVAVMALLNASEVYRDSMEMFVQFVELSKAAGENADNAISGLLEARELYEGDIEKLKSSVRFIIKNPSIDFKFTKLFLRVYLEEGQEAFEAYLDSLKDRSVKLISSEVPTDEVRAEPGYAFMVRYVFPGDEVIDLSYSDRLEHLKDFKFNPEGYPVEFSGLYGYRVVEGKEENPESLEHYTNRLDRIRNFVQSRGPNNEALQEEFRKKVDEVFNQTARAEFRDIPNLTLELKMLIIFLSELLSSGNAPARPEIRDLVVEYKYAFEVDLEGFIQDSAYDVERFKDETSQRYMLWSALSNVYGENLKHTLRHELFEKVEVQESFNLLVEKFGELLGKDKENCLNQKQQERITNTFNSQSIPDTEKFDVLRKQLRIMFMNNIPFQNEEEKIEFTKKLDQILSPLKVTFDQTTLDSLIPQLFSLRNSYRFRLNKRLEELFLKDINTIFSELAKYEEIVEVEAKEKKMNGPRDTLVRKSSKLRTYTTYFTKTKETANARATAHLCLSDDMSMWDNPNYFEAVMQDKETNKCAGIIMFININTADGKRYLWFGPNPATSLLSKVSSKQCFQHQYGIAVQFAQENGYDGVVVPSEEKRILGECTNRGGDYPDLIKSSRLRGSDGQLKIVDFGGPHKLSRKYSYSSGALIWERS